MSKFLEVPDVPESSKPLLARLLVEDLIPVTVLQSAVESYRRAIHEAARVNGVANKMVGDQIAHALQTVLGRIDGRTSDGSRRIIQSAVRYFVIQNDGDGHDLESEDGLYDDGRVVNAVMRWFGRDDLMVQGIPAPGLSKRQQPPPRPGVYRR